MCVARLPRPWDSPGKNTGVGCHFLLQCRKVKSKSEVAQSCPTLSDPMDFSLPGSSVHGISQARILKCIAISISMARCSPRGNPACRGTFGGRRKAVRATERLHFHFSLFCIGEGNGNPLQCSCLENPRDGGAWWAAVCGVAPLVKAGLPGHGVPSRASTGLHWRRGCP